MTIGEWLCILAGYTYRIKVSWIQCLDCVTKPACSLNQIPKSPSYHALTDPLLTLIPSKLQLRGVCSLSELQVRKYWSSPLTSTSTKSPLPYCFTVWQLFYFKSVIPVLGCMHMLMNFIHTTAIITAGSSIKEILARTFWSVDKMLNWKKYPQNLCVLRMLVEQLLCGMVLAPEIWFFVAHSQTMLW